MLIKESEIREYVRQLIKESIEAEAKVIDPEEQAEINKQLDNMRNGRSFNISRFHPGTYAMAEVNKWFKDKGIKKPSKGKGGVSPYMFDKDGNDITPENSEEARAARLQNRTKEKYAKYNRNTISAEKRREMAKEQGISDADMADFMKKNRYSADQGKPDASWLDMTPEEREAESERIRQQRKKAESERAAAEQQKLRDIERNRPRPQVQTKDTIEARIAELKQKQAALGPHCQANDYKWRDYERIIKDEERKLREYYGKKKQEPTKTNDEDDELWKLIGDEYQGSAEEWGDNYIDPNSVDLSNGGSSYETLDDKPKKRGRARDRFDDLEDMGYYDPEDF